MKKLPEQDPPSSRVPRFLADETAATAVEYAVIVALILMVLITAIASLGMGTGGMWGGIQTNLQNVGFIH